MVKEGIVLKTGLVGFVLIMPLQAALIKFHQIVQTTLNLLTELDAFKKAQKCTFTC